MGSGKVKKVIEGQRKAGTAARKHRYVGSAA